MPAQVEPDDPVPEGFPTDDADCVTFDGGVRARVRRLRPDRYRFFDALPDGPTIARGAGLSYAAASFGMGVTTIEHRALNRILGFDSERRVIRVEAGISLGELFAFLAPRKLFLRVQPGHPNITVGGCVATDAHGKGHARHGTFSSQVKALSLAHPEYGLLEISGDRHHEVFDLTCGGYGLTGSILSVDLEVAEARGTLETDVLPVPSLSDLPAALEAAERDWEFVYSWHDMLRTTGPSFGRGFLQVARFRPGDGAVADDVPGRASSLASGTRGRWRLPLLGSHTTRAMNAVHDHRLSRAPRRGSRPVSLFEFQFPIRALESYFRLFGSAGFVEHQVLVPRPAFENWADQLRARLEREPFPVTLASGKLFAGEGRLLRFTGSGVCFAVNAPRSRGVDSLLSFLDRIALDSAAIPNVIKDSRLPRQVVEAAYPEYERFREARRSFDGRRRCRSELSERLGL